MSDAQQNELKPISDEAVEAAQRIHDFETTARINQKWKEMAEREIQSAITKALKRAEISVSEDKLSASTRSGELLTSLQGGSLPKNKVGLPAPLFDPRIHFHYGDLWDAFEAGAREARTNPKAIERDFTKAADAYCKLIHAERDPQMFESLAVSVAPKSDSGSGSPQTLPRDDVDRRDYLTEEQKRDRDWKEMHE